jgi:hypothetical protein
LSLALAAAPFKHSSAPAAATQNPCNRFIAIVYSLSYKLYDTAPGSMAGIELARPLWHDASI